MSKNAEKLIIRQRARFKCENCDEFTLTQYAHIEPDSQDGTYHANNLLYLCYPCHKKLEPTTTAGLLTKTLKNRMRTIRDTPKIDSLVTGIFDELLGEDKIVVHMGGITFIDTPRIFQEEIPNHLVNSFFDVELVKNTLQIKGLLKDENCKPLIFFSGEEFKLFTGDFWDIIRKQGYLEFKNLTRDITLSIKQNDDLSLTLEGNLYLGHRKTTITFDEFVIEQCASFRGNTIEKCRIGIKIGG